QKKSGNPTNGPSAARPNPPAEGRPAAPAEQAPLQPAGLTPANVNDDRQRDFRAFRRAINRRSSNSVYWLVAVLSIVWVSGGAVLARLIDGPDFWKITSLQALLDKPELLGIAVAVVVPLLLFWGFAVMMRRAQD